MKLSEAQIQQTCAELLELDGWRRVRTDLKHLRGLGVQEKGIADDLFIRYDNSPKSVTASVLWIEWKRVDKRGRGTKAAQHQKDWHTLERKRGALTLIAGEDFPASIEGFKAFYMASGLNRRILR